MCNISRSKYKCKDSGFSWFVMLSRPRIPAPSGYIIYLSCSRIRIAEHGIVAVYKLAGVVAAATRDLHPSDRDDGCSLEFMTASRERPLKKRYLDIFCTTVNAYISIIITIWEITIFPLYSTLRLPFFSSEKWGWNQPIDGATFILQMGTR